MDEVNNWKRDVGGEEIKDLIPTYEFFAFLSTTPIPDQFPVAV